MNLSELVRKLQKDVRELTKLVLNVRATGGGGGEANTASNQGAGGVGLYHSKVGVDLQFKNINAGSSKITVTNDVPNKEVDIDVVIPNLGHTHQDAANCGQLDHGLALIGLGDDDHTLYLLADGTRELTANWETQNNILLYSDVGVSSLYATSRLASAVAGGFFRGRHSRGSSALPTATVSGDRLGGFLGQGYDLDSWVTAASIEFFATGTIADTRVPGEIRFYTGTDVAPTINTERMRIDNAGNIRIGGSAALVELLNLAGRLALVETTSPTVTAGWGKLYVKSDDSVLYFMDDSGVEYDLLAGGIASPSFPRFSTKTWAAVTAGDVGKLGIGCAVTAVSPGADSIVIDADGRWHQDLSNAIAGNICHARANSWNCFQPRHNPYAYFHVKTYSEIAHVRLWVGFGTAAFPRATNPNQDEVAFRFSTPDGDVNWMLCLRNAAGTTVIDTGVAVAASTVYRFQLWTPDAGVTYFWDINGISGSSAANAPSVTANWSPELGWIPESAVADALLFVYMYWMWDQN